MVASKHETGEISPLNKGCQRGPAALAELYRLTGGKLFNVALLILKSRDLAEETVQLTYVRIWRDAARFDGSLDLPID
ncbi:hypothetical protein FNL55_07805 [Tardiphaga sp. vice352]|nr:hypothetical protein FNL53_08090 [Tardiphaga sp. vice278]QDM20970.1 hypothetical protein FIU28_07455 [Tardiphaga sp. vice154]QDM26063.1 hypothetical protein FNL56_08140 [Tardiphaga sp. vice304]QDM31212.1 hypothetical protein FNL55_07805 [Tardiphaga sp. vice352]